MGIDNFDFIDDKNEKKVSGIVEKTKKSGKKVSSLTKKGGEKIIVAYVLEFLNSLPMCKARKVHGSAVSASEPDIDCVLAGFSIKIELKDEGIVLNSKTAQGNRIDEYVKCGAISFWSNNKKDFLLSLKDGLLKKTDMLSVNDKTFEYLFESIKKIDNELLDLK